MIVVEVRDHGHGVTVKRPNPLVGIEGMNLSWPEANLLQFYLRQACLAAGIEPMS